MEIPITFAESLIIAVFMMLVVFATLIALYVIIMVFTKLLEKFSYHGTLGK